MCFLLCNFFSKLFSVVQALLYCPWPFPLVLNKVDDCIRGLDLNVKRIIFEDLLLTRKVTEPYDSLPSLLGQCYGNRSAALYELGKHEVCNYIRGCIQAVYCCCRCLDKFACILKSVKLSFNCSFIQCVISLRFCVFYN